MRQLMAGLVIMALGVTGCAASASTGSGKPAGVTSHGTTAAARTSGTATAVPGLGGLTGNGPAGPAQWVVDGTFETKSVPARPLPGVVTFRDTANGRTVQVTVGASGKFSLGLVAGTYTATGQVKHGDPQCAPPVTFTVRAGQLTRVSLVCQASS
jgi:hypothetical protein